MRLTEIEIENYKSIESGKFEPSDVSILIGKNNSGKSNVQESLIRYQERIERTSGWKPSSSYLSNYATGRDQDRAIRFKLQFELSEEEHQEVISHLSSINVMGNQPDLQYVTTKCESEGWFSQIVHELTIEKDEQISVFGNLETSKFWTNYEGELIELNKNRKSIDLSSLPNVEYSNGSLPQVFSSIISESVQSWQSLEAFRDVRNSLSVDESYTINSDGGGLVQVFDTLYRNDKEKYDQIREIYLDIMEGIDHLRSDLKGSNTSAYVEESIIEDGFDLSEVSSGSKQVLILITKIVTAKDNVDLLLLEEPELHLHPGAEAKIHNEIQKIADNNDLQVIISTHSDVFVNQSDTSSVIRVEREGGYTNLRSVSKDEIVEELSDLGYSKSGLLQSDAVVFVEGISDKLIIPEWADTLGLDVGEKGISFVELEGEGNIKSHGRSLVKLLQSFEIPYIFVVDSDEDEPGEVKRKYKQKINRENDNVDESRIWWYTTPEHFHAWSDSDIEYFLLQSPRAIARVVGESTERVEQIISSSEAEKNADVLKEIWTELYSDPDGLAGYQKDADGKRIAKQMQREELDPEIQSLIDSIRDLV